MRGGVRRVVITSAAPAAGSCQCDTIVDWELTSRRAKHSNVVGKPAPALPALVRDLPGAIWWGTGHTSNDPSACAVRGMEELPEDQAAVYDRQLRVWGVEVQRK